MPAADKEVQTIEPWAAWIGVATLVVVAAVAAFSLIEHFQTGQIDRVVMPTAVGDDHYIQEPAGGAGSIGLKYQGHKLAKISEDKVRDSRLIRIGTDDSGVYSIYRPEGEKELSLPKDHYYMKTAPDIFMEVTAQ
jgi:hypothetical protein